MRRSTKGPATVEPGELDETSDPFWSERPLEQLAAEQGVAPIKQLEDVLGAGAGLWADDEDFETFLAAMATTTHSGRY